MNEQETEAMADSIGLAADAMSEVAILTELLREAEGRATFIAEDLNAQIDDEQTRIAELEAEVEQVRRQGNEDRERWFEECRKRGNEIERLRADYEDLSSRGLPILAKVERLEDENERLRDRAERAEGDLARERPMAADYLRLRRIEEAARELAETNPNLPLTKLRVALAEEEE